MTIILYAEDDKDVRDAFGYLLGLEYDLHMVKEGQSALEYFKNNPVDAIITDCVMPRMSGLELARKVREFGFKNPIILMSGNSSIEEIALEAGADVFLEKPVTYKKVKETLDQLLNGEQK